MKDPLKRAFHSLQRSVLPAIHAVELESFEDLVFSVFTILVDITVVLTALICCADVAVGMPAGSRHVGSDGQFSDLVSSRVVISKNLDEPKAGLH